MNKTMTLGMCVLLGSLLAGCPLFVESVSDKEDPLSMEGFSIQTDQEVFLVEDDMPLTITYAYVNESGHPFYPGGCLGVASDVLEKFVDGEWVIAYSPVCPDVLRPPIKVEAGTRFDATISLTSSTWDPAWPSPSWKGGDIEGTYRVRDLIYGEWSMEKFDAGTLHAEIVVSNAFEVRRAP